MRSCARRGRGRSLRDTQEVSEVGGDGGRRHKAGKYREGRTSLWRITVSLGIGRLSVRDRAGVQ